MSRLVWTIVFLRLVSPSQAFAQAPERATPAVAPAPASAAPAFLVLSSYLNRELPAWLRVSGEYRIRPEEHTAYGFAPGVNDQYALSRLRLNVDLTPTSWFHAFVQAQDAEALGIAPNHVTSTMKDVFDLRQLYVDFHDGDNGWFRLRLGRQEFRFGAERAIGVSDWTNVTRVFDGARLTLAHNGDRVDLFSSSVVVDYPTSFDNQQGGMNFQGAYGSIKSLVPGATVEPYAFWKTVNTVKSLEGNLGPESELTWGLRWTGKLPRGFDYAAEGDRQGGRYSNDTIAAWAGYAIAGYSPPFLPLKPRLSAEYAYATGQGAGSTGRMETYDQLYPSNHALFGFSDLFGYRNLRHLRASLEIHPQRRLGLNFDYHILHLASRYDGIYNGSGSEIVKSPSGGALSTRVGDEFDAYFKYKPRANFDLGAGYGRLFAGAFLVQNSKGSNASYPFGYLNYQF